MVIYRHKDKYSISEMCRFFAVSRSGYYDYVKRMDTLAWDLPIIRDLYDNSIVAYKMGTEQNINLVLSTIRAAKKKEKVTAELQLHSDQGFQYTSQAYYSLTESYHITPSMSRRGNPYDNALAEKFFSILKTECIYRTKIRTYKEARLLIDQYIQFYNNERIQLKTKLTPLEKRCQFVG